jgi:hypothetical protein
MLDPDPYHMNTDPGTGMKNLSLYRAPPIPMDHKMHVIRTVRTKGNLALLNDTKKSSNVLKCQLWDSLIESINKVTKY